MTNIWVFAKSADLTEVTEALRRGGDANSRGGNVDSTILMEAVVMNNRALTTLLLEQPDIKINLKDLKGRTVLHYAAYRASTTLIQMLLGVPGINKEAKCYKGVTPLKLGISRGNSVFVSILANTRGVSLYFEDRSMDRGCMRAILMEARRRRERRIDLQERANEARMEREMSGKGKEKRGTPPPGLCNRPLEPVG